MERTPAYLAALASSAVPGLDPVTVEALLRTPEHHFDVVFVMDAQDRRWVVRAPRDEAAAARMDQGFALLTLLGRRLPFAVPSPRGFTALKEGGRAAVYPFLAGRSLDLTALPPGPGPAGELGRAIAAIHNTDPRLFEEAGAEVYDADVYRLRRLADLDRAAGTGRVPRALLARWEQALEDASLWRFAATPVHGALDGEDVLMVFDGEELTGARVKAVLGWEDAKVADPADDFAQILALAPPEAMDTVLEAYAHSRVERPDPNLLVRARLAGELGQLAAFISAVGRDDAAATEVLTTQLRRLEAEIQSAAPDDYHRTSLAPVRPRTRPTPVPAIEPDEAAADLEDDVRPPAGEDDLHEEGHHEAPIHDSAPATPLDGATDEADVLDEEFVSEATQEIVVEAEPAHDGGEAGPAGDDGAAAATHHIRRRDPAEGERG